MAAVLHIEFAQNVLYMVFNSQGADVKNDGYFPVALASMHPLQDFFLTRGHQGG